ncbi:hypothetical protein TNCV_2985911 [Trichonephila clavipes]|nr:hypothetical protein TNCV_2985911 [Trichonephila clavipes]
MPDDSNSSFKGLNLQAQEHRKWSPVASRGGKRESDTRFQKLSTDGVGALKVGTENQDLDFRNSLNFAGYCRNETEWLHIQIPRIVVTLLDGEQTAHSAFKLPLDIHKKPDAMRVH